MAATTIDQKLRALKAPFEEHEIEWRINRKGSTQKRGPWAVAIPYITSRAVQERLDQVFGLFGWQNEVKQVGAKGFLSGISIEHEGKWITKWDGAEGSTSSGQDLFKSGSSNALKRAAVLLGIGRYLYELEEVFVTCRITDTWQDDFGNVYKDKDTNTLVAWVTPLLPLFALPLFDIGQYIKDMKAAETHEELNLAYDLAKRASNLHDNEAMRNNAIEVGTEMRRKLNDKAELEKQGNVKEDLKEIEFLLDRQIESFSKINNVASVKKMHEAFSTELKNKVDDSILDVDEFKERLDQAFECRIEMINNTADEINLD